MATMVQVPFQIERVAVLANTQKAIIAPLTCQSVTVLNATTGDVRVEAVADGSQYLVIASGFERVFWLPQPVSGQFRKDHINFWLRPDASGTVILVWA